MKLVIRTIFFHIICIFVFTGIYYSLDKHFIMPGNKEFSFIDCVALSTTIQSSVGITNVIPTSNISKIVMMIQQMLLIMIYVFTVYIFAVK